MNRQDWDEFIKIFPLISTCYGKAFNESQVNLWWTLLADHDLREIYNAVNEHMKESSFEPRPADIIKRMGPDTDAAFARMINREPPQSDIEQLTNADVGYACKTSLNERDARLLYAKRFKQILANKGRTQAPISRQIEHKPEPKATDSMVDAAMDKYKNKSKEEIQEMLHSMNNKTKLKR